jgi:hypothetical protein
LAYFFFFYILIETKKIMSAAEIQGVSKQQMRGQGEQARASALTGDFQSSAVPAESEMLTMMTLQQLVKNSKLESERPHITAGISKQLMYLDKAGQILHTDNKTSGISVYQQMQLQNLFGTDFRGQVQLADMLKEEVKQREAKEMLSGAVTIMQTEQRNGGTISQRMPLGAFSVTPRTA